VPTNNVECTASNGTYNQLGHAGLTTSGGNWQALDANYNFADNPTPTGQSTAFLSTLPAWYRRIIKVSVVWNIKSNLNVGGTSGMNSLMRFGGVDAAGGTYSVQLDGTLYTNTDPYFTAPGGAAWLPSHFNGGTLEAGVNMASPGTNTRSDRLFVSLEWAYGGAATEFGLALLVGLLPLGAMHAVTARQVAELAARAGYRLSAAEAPELLAALRGYRWPVSAEVIPRF
jgi:hypothetical protein